MADLSDPIVQELTKARVKLLFEKPFFGSMAIRLNLVDASSWCKTAATDGRNFYYNREFIKSLDVKKGELLFLMGHEVMHCIYDHFGRRGGRDPKVWNMANDYIINWTLVEEKCGSMPPQGLYDKAYTDDMTSEEVYNLLMKNSVTIKMPLDEHLELGGDDDGQQPGGNGSGDVEVRVMGKDGPPKLSEDDLQRIRAEIKTAMIQAAQSVSADKIPLGVRRMIDELINPKLDWRTLLDAHIRSTVKDDYTFQHLSRRTMAMRAAEGVYRFASVPILPAQNVVNTIKIAVAIDTSGSMTEEMLRDFLSETYGIMTSFPSFEVHLFTFDTEVYNPENFTPENIEDIKVYPMAGGGGTMFETCWEHMKREGIEPERFIMFTDGYPNSTWGDANYCDTLFIVHGDNSRVAPFGLTAYYEAK